VLDPLEIEHVRPYEEEMHRSFQNEHPEVLEEIREKKEISAELEETILAAMREAREDYVARKPEASVQQAAA
jgi:F-type H+-transporting ATPase subunit alpha